MIKGVDFVGVSVVYFCHDGKGNFVMLKRGQNARDEKGRWDIGAGAVEFGDSIEITLKKEIREEYGASVLDFEFLGFREIHRTQEGVKTHWLSLDFKVLVDPKEVKNNEPHKFDGIGWFTKEKLPKEPTHSEIPIFFEKYKNVLWI